MRSFAILTMSWVAVSLWCLVPGIAQLPDPPVTETSENTVSENQSARSVAPDARIPSDEIPRLLGPEGVDQEAASVAGGTDDQQEDVQALTRGPLHEAFAEQVNLDPRATLVVPDRPPAPVREVPPEIEPEGENVDWIAGYWAWDDEQKDFMWISGLWRNIPPDRRWLPGDWIEVEGGYRWIQGTWAPDDAAELGVRELPPDSLEQGPNTEAPSEQHIWIPGCWVDQGGDYLWRAGFWSHGNDDWIWVPQRYLWRPSGCIFVPGYWDYPVVNRGTLFAPCRFHRPVYAHVDYRYSPSVVLNLGHIFEHMFVRPRHCHYYFGDYYASDSWYPWHTYYRNYYCPLLTHYDWYHNRRGFNYLLHLRNFHYHMVAHANYRPRRRFRRHRDPDERGERRTKRRDDSGKLKRRDDSGKLKRRPPRAAKGEVAAELGTSVKNYNKNVHQSKGVGEVRKRLVSDGADKRQRRIEKGRKRRVNSSAKLADDGSSAGTKRKSPTARGPKATASRAPEKKGKVTADRRKPSRDRGKTTKRRNRGSQDVAGGKKVKGKSRPDVTKRSRDRSNSNRTKSGSKNSPTPQSSRSRKTERSRAGKVSPPGRSSVPRQSLGQSQGRSNRGVRTNPKSNSSRARSGSTRSSGRRSDRGQRAKSSRGGGGRRKGRK